MAFKINISKVLLNVKYSRRGDLESKLSKSFSDGVFLGTKIEIDPYLSLISFKGQIFMCHVESN